MKTQSAANSAPHDRPIFFVERSLGREKVAGALREAGVRVEVHEDHFKPDELDTVWLKVVGERGWVVLSKDTRIRYNKLELHTLRSSGVRAFILARGDLSGEEMASIFVDALPDMLKLLEKHRSAFVARITRNANVAIVEPPPASTRRGRKASGRG